jgi:hypothetical protein
MFKRAKVIEIISHPYVLKENILNTLLNDSEKKISDKKNIHLLKDLPRNSIVAQLVNENSRIIAIPFFSSHLGFPLKQGETVWIYKEENTDSDNAKRIEYFWLSRIHGMNFYEDTNYTHDERKYLRRYEDKKGIDLSTEIDMLENGYSEKTTIAQFNDGEVYNTQSGNLSGGKGKINIKKTPLNISGKHIFEDVPRFTKHPGDLILQGSNNTLIKLGIDEGYPSNFSLFEASSPLAYKENKKYSGTIDIVAGRAAISKEYLTIKKYTDYHLNKEDFLKGKNVTTKAFRNGMNVIYNEKKLLENLKDTDYYLENNYENIAEGDTDFFTDISRLYISEYSTGDQLLNINNVYTATNDKKAIKINSIKSSGKGFVIAKSDEIRIIAREKSFNLTRENDIPFNSNIDNLFSQGGAIRLIKEGNDENIAYLCLENDGVVSLNGSKIILGDENKIKENGKSENVYIGHNAKEPLVLGYFLKNKLENFMNEVCKSLILVSKNLDEINKKYNSHTHPYAGVAGNTLPSSSLVVNSVPIPETSINASIDPVKGAPSDENGDYGNIQGLVEPLDLNQSIDNIVKIKESLVEILSQIGRTL